MPVYNHIFFSPVEALGRELSELMGRPSYLLRGDDFPMNLPDGGLGMTHQVNARCLPNWNDEDDEVRFDAYFEEAWAQTPHSVLFIPPPEVLGRLRQLTLRHAATIALFLNHERGDNLYDQYAWVFERAAKPNAQGLMLSERLYCMDDSYHPSTFEGARLAPCPTPDVGTSESTPMFKLLQCFGVERGSGYFPPDDQSSFDYEPYRWPND